jgi:superfamily II DNA or RNA helicase
MKRPTRGGCITKNGLESGVAPQRETPVAGNSGVTSLSLLPPDIEFIRNCFVLVPRKGEKPFKTVCVAPVNKNEKPRLFCSCNPGGYASCEHAGRLAISCGNFLGQAHHLAVTEGRFSRLIMPLAKSFTWQLGFCRLDNPADGAPVSICRNGRTIVEYASQADDRERFVERMVVDDSPCSRRSLIRHAEHFVLSNMEQALAGLGETTTRRAAENSVWFGLLYHLCREFAGKDIVCSPLVDETNGTLWITLRHALDNAWFVRWSVPAEAVGTILERVRDDERTESAYKVLDGEAELRFSVTMGTDTSTVTFSPFIEQDNGTASPVRVALEPRFIFGDHVYLPPLLSFKRLSQSSLKIIAGHWNGPKSVPVREAGALINKNLDMFSISALNGGNALPDLFLSGGDDLARLDGVKIIRSFDHVDLVPTKVTVDFCELTASYVGEGAAAPLGEILEAHSRGERFLVSCGCIVDLKSVPLTRLYNTMRKTGKKGGIRLPRAALMQLTAVGSIRLEIDKKKPWAADLQNMLELKPTSPLAPMTGFTSVLRPYQHIGISWLLFLCDNGFGGLLCDDMGLGKTHQILGLICALREQRRQTAPFVVVCPTTVLPHWLRLAATFAPGVTTTVITGQTRDWDVASTADLVLTTYGALRTDVDAISAVRFGLAVFDEAQYIKNPTAQTSIAARTVNASVKICCTGTPIENTVTDLKSLFDIVMPNYLGADDDFFADFAGPIEERGDKRARENLKKLTAPFLLRRMKKTVLTDLPPKIEDVRTCDLSNEQALLYDSLVKKRGGPLLAQLRNDDAPVPYMHIFALLSALKQLCDHPALLAARPGDFEKHQSGKWDLFVELLDEILNSGQKTVVYSQYLDMIEIIRFYLDKNKIGAAVLTGASKDRGEIVRRFSEDDSCRVFVGSLKAGGTGIDLVAASTVIHYDRWWNAAREDQATDRVHRIGQTRGVQVFKLVSKNTVEEKIDALIAKRRDLAETLLDEDAPDEMKSFTREELMTLLEAR